MACKVAVKQGRKAFCLERLLFDPYHTLSRKMLQPRQHHCARTTSDLLSQSAWTPSNCLTGVQCTVSSYSLHLCPQRSAHQSESAKWPASHQILQRLQQCTLTANLLWSWCLLTTQPEHWSQKQMSRTCAAMPEQNLLQLGKI